MTKLDEQFQHARSNYLMRLRNRQAVKNDRGTRWQQMDEKLIVAEEEYHRIGAKIKERDVKKVSKKKTTKKSPTKAPSFNPSGNDSTYTPEPSGFVVSGGNGKSIWDL